VVDGVDGRFDLGADGGRDRPVDLQPGERVDQRPGEEPGVAAHRQRSLRSGPADPGDELFDEATVASIGGAFAQPGVQHLPGVSPGGQQRVVAEHSGVAVGGALLGLAVDFTDRRVQIDRHRSVTGTGAELPGPPDRLADHPIELADVPEGERPQERAQRRRRHHFERQHLVGCSGTQPVGVIDVTPSREDRSHQSEHLAARSGTAHPANQSKRLVDQRFQAEAHHQRCRHDQAGIGDQCLVVEGRLDAVDHLRYWGHRKCLLDLADGWLRNRHSPRSGGTFRGYASYLTPPHR
jgi:hypothetical protein